MYNLRPVPVSTVRPLFEEFHGYKSVGKIGVYCFGVYEGDLLVAAYVWQPPPPGASKSVCPEAPHGVLALSRMVALPKSQRSLKHISKPLRYQMKHLIDRTRYPVLITYSDEGQGHTGHVYKCSGWTKTTKRSVPYYEDAEGRRVSSYSSGAVVLGARDRKGTTIIQRWEHWVCERGQAAESIRAGGWRRVPTGKFWRSGNPAFTWRQ